MDIQSIVKELKRERDRLSKAIAALEDTESPANSPTSRPAAHASAAPRPTGNRLSAEGRRRLSEAMKKRWAERRRKSARGEK